ncbi:ATP-dependent RNA helicase BRR2 [Paracoccidioides brasiliensis Pb18]|uniref:RNA helicase n=1 Tax=Paracoccidioides brasiliensis (strain Pb18) TaxID=502780 RepID=C1G5P0_PARBD|nr:ATP-dependent RNA helicase BRR2 [Paracoccidioides brasiliensis Pb18]EEH46397.1 hypothetical protein PADG_02495 [Paracoccidioides brasiliensis Pb18]
MADPNNVSQYKYSAMSNLVLQADRRFVTRRTDEVTGDPESLAGRINIKDMGTRVSEADAAKVKRVPVTPRNVERDAIREGEAVLQREQRKRKRGEPAQMKGAGILSAADTLIEGLKYRPRTPVTRATYDLILTMTSNHLGDVSHEVIRSAADAVLELLKDENMKDFDKKKEIDDLLGSSMGPKEFNELVNLGKKITDYDAQDEDENMENGADGGQGGEELDERQGVAVVFDEPDDEEENFAHEVRDADEHSDEDMSDEEDRPDREELATAGGAAAERDKASTPDEEIIIDGTVEASNGDKTNGSAKVVPIREIDAYWLQREIGSVYSDAHIQQEKTREALQMMGEKFEDGSERPLRDVENDLMELFDYDYPDLVGKLITNRDRIVWVTKWRRTADDADAKAVLEKEMVEAGQYAILDELRGKSSRENGAEQAGRKMRIDLMDIDIPGPKPTEAESKPKDGVLTRGLQPKKLINLENLIFDQGNHLMTNPNVKLPQGSTKRTFKGYEEIHVPAPKPKRDPNERLISISDLPDWARPSFKNSEKLNRIQTMCFPMAFNDDGNMLVCAPTGSGKTNVAMLTILREIGKNRNSETGEIMLDDFKIVYIAPLKALVQEQVGNFGERLKPYGIRVSELTGDRQLTKNQIADTQIIVTTPEKWDVITRKATDTSYTRLVRLIIIDEIHLLHDDRGPVLESIVSRTIRKMEQTCDPVRLIGLSATLPNYRDVGSFLRVDPINALFHFDGSYRPCPLKQEFIGVTDKKAIKQLKTMNDVCYTKVLEQVGANKNQMLIFVHSRKETAKTARYIRDKAVEMETIGQILRSDAASRAILTEEADAVNDPALKDLMPYGFGIHHAGMSLADRISVQELFADGSLQVLVCTATLAWGVNLPAHTVIIKGTQVYSPEKGSWVELSPQDVLQMLGRAGRPQYDTFGEGIIITSQTEMQYYLSLLNQQLPIESQLMSKLADNLNAEIVLGNVRNRDEGVEWLGYTYLFVRMLRSPGLYSVGTDYENDQTLEQRRVDLIHSAATILEKANLIKYEKKTGKLQSTELGRIASHYYITHSSMNTYNYHLQPMVSTIELFRIFALSDEFKYIPVRQDEKLELAKLLGRVPIPVKESIEEPHAKVNVLLQAYISRLKLEGLALMADMVYVTQSAGRILRAMFEIALKKGWASVAKIALSLCKMAEKRMWPTMSPLRQFPSCPRDILQKSERIDIPWSTYFDLDPPRVGELLGMPKAGRTVCDLISKFPRLDVQAQVQPITRSMLRVELTITPNFTWDDDLHGVAESFWIIVEDCDGEDILFHDQFILRKEFAVSEMNEHLVEFTTPITEPMPPNYFISLVSDRWMHSETKIPVSFQKLILPERFPAHTPLLDMQRVPVKALKQTEYQKLYPHWDHFNKIQTQAFKSLFDSDDNVFLGAPTGSGKTVCAEFALLHHWSKSKFGKAVYIAPFQELIDHRLSDWQSRLGNLDSGKNIAKLTGETTADLKILEKADLVLATPIQWDVLSRQWQRRKNVQAVDLFIADELHMLGGQGGYIYEIIVSRMHYIALQTEKELRMIGLSVPLSNARDIGEWLGAKKHTVYNFSPHVRPVPLELHIQSYTIPHFPSLMLAMVKPALASILQLSPDKPVLLFVPTRKQTRSTALDLLAACIAADGEDIFLHADVEELSPLLKRIDEQALAESITHGIGYYHEALSNSDKRIVSHLFKIGAIQVMLASRDVCWEINFNAHLVIVMNTQFFDGREHRYIDYPISEILQMFGKASRPLEDKSGKGVLMVPAVKRDYYKKFLNEALPIESHLQIYLHDAFVTEISTRTIASTQDAVDWMTYTYFYRRLLANPSYYGLTDVSHEGLSTFLSELVENTLKELSEAKIIDLDEEDDTLSPLNAAMIAAYYNISFITMQTFLLSLTARTKLKGILEIVTSATEFETIQVRRHEEHILRRVYDRVPVKMSQPVYDSPHFKAFILLQAHFSRMQLPIDLGKDQEVIVSKVLNLLSACVDVLSSEGHLNAMNAMEMSQMVVQAMWDRDSPLKQIPHFGPEAIKVANEFHIKDIFEFMEAMDPSENKDYATLVKRLGLNNKHLAQAAEFTNNKYPNVDLDFTVLDEENITAGEPAYIDIKIERDVEEDEEVDTTVSAPFYPGKKMENWWLVVGEEKTNSLLATKRVTIGKKLQLKLEYIVPTPGEHELTLFLMSDSYVGVDQDPSFKITAAEGMDEDEEEDDGEEVMLSAPRRSAAIPNASGTLLAYTQTTYSFESHLTTTELRVLDVATGSSVLLTNSYRGSPQWLGDGNKLVWLKEEGDGTTSFIVGDGKREEDSYVAGTVSGPVSDLKVTTISRGLVGFAVSGKGNQDGTLYNPSTAKKPVSSGKLYTSLFVRHWDEYIQPQKNNIWYGTLQQTTSSTEGQRSKYKLSELKNLFRQIGATDIESPIPPFCGTDHFDICPRGIVFVARDPNLNPALHTKCLLYYCRLQSWTEAVPVSAKTLTLDELKGAITSPVLSPVKNTLAVLAMREDGYESDKNRIILVPSLFDAQTQPIELFATAGGASLWSLSPSSLAWGEDDSDLFIRAEDTGRCVVFRLPIPNYANASIQHLSKLTHSGYVIGLALASKKLFLSSTSLVENSVFSYIDLSKPGQEQNVVCSSSRHGVSLGLVREQVSDIWWRGADDRPIHAWVIKPSDFVPQKRYPLCYLIHGGPQGAWNDQWSIRWNPAVFAEQGYVVITPNPTGSTGYGQEFTDAIQNEWGGKPYEDIVRGFEYIERELDYVDTDHAVAMGASFGGFMINWIQGHDLGRKFKALVTHDGIFSTKFSLAAEELYFPIRDLKGVFWQVPENWDRWDPSLFLDKWATPHLIIHNELDYRLTISEGLAAFNVLQMRGVPSAFLTFPDENHWVLKPENSLFWHRTVINWINKYAGLPPLLDTDAIDGFPAKIDEKDVWGRLAK